MEYRLWTIALRQYLVIRHSQSGYLSRRRSPWAEPCSWGVWTQSGAQRRTYYCSHRFMYHGTVQEIGLRAVSAFLPQSQQEDADCD